MAKLKVGRVEELLRKDMFTMLSNGLILSPEKCNEFNIFIDKLTEAFKPYWEKSDKKLGEIINKYGTEEEIKNNRLEKDSPNYDNAIKDYEEYMKSIESEEIEVDTNVDFLFFKERYSIPSRNTLIEDTLKYLFG